MKNQGPYRTSDRDIEDQTPAIMPEHRIEKTIEDLAYGTVFWVTPWTLDVSLTGECSIYKNLSVNTEQLNQTRPTGNLCVRVEKLRNGIKVTAFVKETYQWHRGSSCHSISDSYSITSLEFEEG